MILGSYEIDGMEYCNIYTNNAKGRKELFEDTYGSLAKNIQTLVLQVGGKTYAEKKAWLEELAKDYQLYFAPLWWSYGELIDIQYFFYENGKRYGLLKKFKENAIC